MKRKLLKNWICFTICGSVFAGLFSVPVMTSFAVSEKTQNAIDQTKEEKQELEEELLEQEQEKENLESEKKEEEQRLNSLKQQAQDLNEELETLRQQVFAKEEEIEEKQKELAAIEAKHQEQYEAMKLRIRYAYETQKPSFIALFFQERSIAGILNHVDDTRRMQEYDKEQMEKYAQMAEKIAAQKQELENDRAELQQMMQNTERMQTEVAALQERTRESIQTYLEEIALAETEIGNTQEALEEKSKALRQLYEKAQAEEEAERARQAEEAAKNLQNALANGSIKPGDSGIVYGEMNLTSEEMDMLTAMIYCESRGESYEGQLAVGHVIMNRLRSTKYPNQLEAVLRQHLQFEPAGSGRFDIVLTAYWQNIPGVIGQAEWESCRKAAEASVNGESNVGECLFFRTHAPVPQLAENLKSAGVPYWIIGNHIFYYSWVNY